MHVRGRGPAACWDEATFRHLLAVEEARARRSSRSFLVLVVVAERSAAGRTGYAGGGMPELVEALTGCLRETDLVGWHRTNFRAAVLLTETDSELAAARLVGAKALRKLGNELPADLVRRLRVRIHQYSLSGARARFRCLFAAVGGRELTAGTLRGTRGDAPAGWTLTNSPSGLRLTEAALSRRARSEDG